MVSVNIYKLGPLKTNCYLIKDLDKNKMAIIDPGGISKALDEEILRDKEKNFSYILLTHGHFDHIRKAQRYRELTGAKIVILKDEKEFTKDSGLNLSKDFGKNAVEPFEADIFVEDGDVINLGNTKIKVLKTPGHTKGSVCYVLEDCIFSGDTLMKGSIGRTDLVTGCEKDMLDSIKKIDSLKGNFVIYPGHGDFTDLDYERKNNFYFRKDINDFIR